MPSRRYWFVPEPLAARMRPYVQVLRRLRNEGVHGLAFGRPIFSQFGEDQFLAARFSGQPLGFYVDVGAFHPFRFSNTCLLYPRGWRGINIEPDPDALSLFERYRPRDLNVQMAVASVSGEATFKRAGAFAGIDDGSYLWHEHEGERITVTTQPLASILDERLPPDQHIDVLDVDCEGLDLDVLKSNDWRRFRPTIVLAEAHDLERSNLTTSFMQSVGYRPVTQIDLTLVFELVSTGA